MTEKEIILKQIDILQARQETEGLNVDEHYSAWVHRSASQDIGGNTSTITATLYFSCDCIISSGDGNSQQSEADNSSIKAGDKVRVLVNATYDGGSFIMYYDTYDVLEVNGDRAVIGIGDTVTCAINTCNIERV